MLFDLVGLLLVPLVLALIRALARERRRQAIARRLRAFRALA
jgi:hypothetical protein